MTINNKFLLCDPQHMNPHLVWGGSQAVLPISNNMKRKRTNEHQSKGYQLALFMCQGPGYKKD